MKFSDTLATAQAAHTNANPNHLSHAVACGPACLPQTGKVQEGIGAQIGHFFTKLFDTADWPPRWHCGTWSDFHGWLYIFSDLLIWVSYYAIPFLLIWMITRRKDIPFPKIVWLFIAFIILCGTTHLMDAIIFWWPAYRLSALIRLLTGAVSSITVYALYRIMPTVLSLRTVDELEREIEVRKAAERKLEASEFLLKEAGRLARMGGWEFDQATQKSTWSAAVYDIFGVPQNYNIDQVDVFAFFEDHSRQQLKDSISNASETGTGWDLELQLITAKNQNIWVRSCGECFYDDDKGGMQMRGVIIDINKYKANELELNKSHELLFRSHQQLKTFTHILSHNIRNHSSNIALLSDMIDAETLDENNADLFDKIGKVSGRLNTTLNDLSNALKVREDVPSDLLSFREVSGHAIEILEHEILTNGTHIKFDFKVETVMFPRLYLESILLNLISNAIKYRKDDEPPAILLRTYVDEQGNTILECEDNGIGIDLKLHGKKVFGLYKTFHTHKDAHGVGLFLVKTQVESQSGTIEVDSHVGVGTTFKITFKPAI